MNIFYNDSFRKDKKSLTSDRINNIIFSPTMKIASKAIIMKSEGIDVVDFSVGEPDFPTPQHIKEAAKKGIDNNFTKYTTNEGMADLRKAIIGKLKRENDLNYELNEIMVSNGAKQAIFNVIMAVVNEGDEVIIPAPYYVSYPEMVKIAGGKPVILDTEETNGFKVTPGQLSSTITDKTKALILCNPSNPTGIFYTESELKTLSETVLAKRDILIISDEVYEKLIYDDQKFVSLAAVYPKDRAVVINGVSKAYAMTGWRIGYAAAVKEIIAGACKMQSHSTSGASSVSQYASIAALNGPQEQIKMMVTEFEKRRNYVWESLIAIPGIKCIKPEGAFYIFPDVTEFYGRKYGERVINNSYDLAYYLLEEAKVTVVPGEAFGSGANIRISYSTSMENIKEGISRIQAALAKLK